MILNLRSGASAGSSPLICLLYDEHTDYLTERRKAQATGETPIAVTGEFDQPDPLADFRRLGKDRRRKRRRKARTNCQRTSHWLLAVSPCSGPGGPGTAGHAGTDAGLRLPSTLSPQPPLPRPVCPRLNPALAALHTRVPHSLCGFTLRPPDSQRSGVLQGQECPNPQGGQHHQSRGKSQPKL